MNVYKGLLLKKSSNRKSKLILSSCVNAGHYMAFKHHISFAANLAANFGCYQFRIKHSFQAFARSHDEPSEVAALFNSNLSSTLSSDRSSSTRRYRLAALHRIWFKRCCFVPMSYFLWQVVIFSSIETCCFAQDSIQKMLFCSYVIFLLRDEWMIEDLAKLWALPWSATTSILLYWNFISHEKKKVTIVARNLQSIKTFLALELSQYRKSGSMFSSSEPVAASSDCRRLWNAVRVLTCLCLSICLCLPCVCACQSDLHKQSLRAAPRAWQLILPSKPSITFWNSLQKDCQMTCRGLNLDSNLNCAAWPTSCKGFIAS